jgi:tRNA(Arg) A34 adenosine deaminase TadA
MHDISRDKHLLKAALQVAERSMTKGNLPFGCVLADARGNVIEEGENTVITSLDSIAHCEINLVHQLAGKFDSNYLESCSLYASTEPCPMCTGAVFWSGIGRIVFALSKEGYHSVAATNHPAHIFNISAEKLLTYGKRKVEVIGPLLEEEASQLYKKWLWK